MFYSIPSIRYVCLRTTLPMVLCLFLVSLATGIEPGDRVVVIDQDRGIQNDGEQVDQPPLGDVLTVQEVHGNWLEVSRGKPGTISANDVIPLDEAIDYFTVRIRRDSDNYRLYTARSNVSEVLGDYETALLDINEAIRLNSQDAELWNRCGIIHRSLQDYDRAISNYNRSIALGNDSAAIYNNRANAWDNKGEHDRAIEDYTEAIRIDPEFVFAYDNRGISWAIKGEYDRAIEDFTAAIRLNPDYTKAYFYRGNVWDRKGEYDRAIEDFTAAIRLDPDNARTYNSLAWLMATCSDEDYRDGERAVEYGIRACELSNWEDAGWIDTLAAAYAEAGDFEKAVETIQKAIDMISEDHAKNRSFQERLEMYENNQPYR